MEVRITEVYKFTCVRDIIVSDVRPVLCKTTELMGRPTLCLGCASAPLPFLKITSNFF